MSDKKAIGVHTEIKFKKGFDENGKPCVRVQFPGFMLVDGIQFKSPEHILTFCEGLMEKAVEIWPNDPWVKEYTK